MQYFYLAGNPEDEFQQQGQGRRQQQQHQQHEQQNNNNNVLSGFSSELLADVFNMDVQTIRKLQGSEEERRPRKNIVKVDGELQVIRPPRSRQEQEREEEREHRQSGRGRDVDNGLEETLCTLRLRENIGDASRADIYNPEAGRISTLNSNKLRLLNWLQLSAERGKLNRVIIIIIIIIIIIN